MGILGEMFDEEENLPDAYEGEFLAEGDYESDREEMLNGYKAFRKRYVAVSLVQRLAVVLLALASSVFMIISSREGEKEIPVFCLILCIFIGGWFISQSLSNKKKYIQSVDSLVGIPYHAEFYTDRVKITDMSPVPEKEEEASKNGSEENAQEEIPENEEKNPSTVIHLDQHIVEILDKENLFILVVRKAYVFIIPKKAFTEEGQEKIREKLSAIMGIRYKN